MTHESYLLGATFLAALLEGDEREIDLFHEHNDAGLLLDSLVPQLLTIAKRFCDDRGITLDELGERMVGAALLRASWGIEQPHP